MVVEAAVVEEDSPEAEEAKSMAKVVSEDREREEIWIEAISDLEEDLLVAHNR